MKKYQVGGLLLFMASVILFFAGYQLMFGTIKTGWGLAVIGTVCIILFYKKG